MRSSPGLSDRSVRPSFLRTTAVKKPRAEWGCQPVAIMIAAIVVPLGCLSRVSTASCLVPARITGEGKFPGFPGLFAPFLASASSAFGGIFAASIFAAFDPEDRDGFLGLAARDGALRRDYAAEVQLNSKVETLLSRLIWGTDGREYAATADFT